MPTRLPMIEAETLPPRLAGWAQHMLGGPIPREVHATCDRCAMVPRDDDAGERASFDADLKCCTYLPELPNFSVGAMLSDASVDPTSLVKRIHARSSVTPLGLGQPPSRVATPGESGFGKDPALLCPHFAGGQCTIWAHRDSVCATYFCKLQRGRVGLRFWSALRSALATLERAVARRCMLEVGISPSAIAAMGRLAPTQTVLPAGSLMPEEYRQIWGAWEGREQEFFRACALTADGLTWTNIEHSGGVELAMRMEAVRHEYHTLMAPSLPTHPVARAVMIRPASSELTEVVAYSALDPIALPKLVVSALGHFDGRPLAEALSAARERERVAISDELLQTLTDFAVIGDEE